MPVDAYACGIAGIVVHRRHRRKLLSVLMPFPGGLRRVGIPHTSGTMDHAWKFLGLLVGLGGTTTPTAK